MVRVRWAGAGIKYWAPHSARLVQFMQTHSWTMPLVDLSAAPPGGRVRYHVGRNPIISFYAFRRVQVQEGKLFVKNFDL